jgi:hypothetical protein
MAKAESHTTLWVVLDSIDSNLYLSLHRRDLRSFGIMIMHHHLLWFQALCWSWKFTTCCKILTLITQNLGLVCFTNSAISGL